MGSITPETLNSSSSLNSPTTGSDSSSSPAAQTGRRSTEFLCGLHNKLKQKKALRSLIKEQNQKIFSLNTSLAEKNAEAKKWKELYLKRMEEEIKSLKLDHQEEKKYNCGSPGTSSDNSQTTSLYDQTSGGKARYDEDYVSGHHTNSNPAAG